MVSREESVTAEPIWVEIELADARCKTETRTVNWRSKPFIAKKYLEKVILFLDVKAE